MNISIEPRLVFMAYLLFCIGGIVFLWAREVWRSRSRYWALSGGRTCFCDNCNMTFLMPPHENITRCPRCNEICLVSSKK